MKISIVERSQGMLLGTAVGDLLGSPIEGYDLTLPPDQQKLFKGYQNIDPTDIEQGWKPKAAEVINEVRKLPGQLVIDYLGHLGTEFWRYGETTDDTYQSVVVTESLIANGGFDGSSVARGLVKWYDGGRGRGCGGTTGVTLQLLDPEEVELPVPWFCASKLAQQMTEAQGAVPYQARHHKKPYDVRAIPSNGGLMRAAPIGVYYRDEPFWRKQYARDLSSITHDFKECIDSARLYTDLIAHLANGRPKSDALNQTRSDYADTYEAAMNSLEMLDEETGHTGSAYTTLGVALDSFSSTDSFEAAVVSAINSNRLRKTWINDTDTYGAITGALAGTYYGVSSIPKRWYELQHPNGVIYDLSPYSTRTILSLGAALVESAAA